MRNNISSSFNNNIISNLQRTINQASFYRSAFWFSKLKFDALNSCSGNFHRFNQTDCGNLFLTHSPFHTNEFWVSFLIGKFEGDLSTRMMCSITKRFRIIRINKFYNNSIKRIVNTFKNIFYKRIPVIFKFFTSCEPRVFIIVNKCNFCSLFIIKINIIGTKNTCNSVSLIFERNSSFRTNGRIDAIKIRIANNNFSKEWRSFGINFFTRIKFNHFQFVGVILSMNTISTRRKCSIFQKSGHSIIFRLNHKSFCGISGNLSYPFYKIFFTIDFRQTKHRFGMLNEFFIRQIRFSKFCNKFIFRIKFSKFFNKFIIFNIGNCKFFSIPIKIIMIFDFFFKIFDNIFVHFWIDPF